MIAFVYLYAWIIPYLGFVEDQRPYGYGVDVLRKWTRNPSNFYFDFAFYETHGSTSQEQVARTMGLFMIRSDSLYVLAEVTGISRARVGRRMPNSSRAPDALNIASTRKAFWYDPRES